ncbi:zinc finger protein CG2199 [Drosophila obscura]|uniref:zinc finger protein CG2199 n=1 Tax=Drosophila obscura TaxID=7282 RepID=UPI001BB1C108|nr:zinc finger protein CG2199 [Drosophila obscura]
MVNVKKEVTCDYCGTSNEPGQMLSAKKAYFGSKVSDVLHTITKRNIPSTLSIKVCFICFSKFVQCERTIQKIQEFVDQSLAPSGGKKKSAKDDEEDEVVNSEEVKKKKPMKKRSFSVPGLGTLQPPTIIEAPQQPKCSTGKPDSDILDNSVVLKPAKTSDNKKNNSILSIFGRRATTAADDSEEEDEEEQSETEEKELPQSSALFPAIFECRRCDFKVRYQKPMKQHYKQVHGQQRPRIYFCPMCAKSFGVAKTLKEHAKAAHGIEDKPKEKSGAGRAKTVEKELPAARKRKKSEMDVEVAIKGIAEVDEELAIEVIEAKSPLKAQTSLLKQQPRTPSSPQTPVKPPKTPLKLQTEVQNVDSENNNQSLAVIRALNEHKKKKNVTNTDYTFAINDSSASTPKQNGEPMPSTDPLICSICDAEQTSVKTMQRHMSTSHGIDKPKIFKCTKCEKSLASKQSLNHHLTWHLANPQAEVTSKRQILQGEGPPNKRNKTKEAEDESNDVADGAGSSLKQSKKLSETTNDVTGGNASPKKSKKLSETANDVVMPSPKKSKKLSETTNDVAESSLKNTPPKELTVSLLSDEEKWIFPRPKKTKKDRKESESVNISNGNDLNVSQSYPLDELAEVNPTVQPHKREMLASLCESTTADESEFNCSQCPKSVKSQRRLESHITKMHGRSLKCSNCYNKFHTRQTYVVHFGECEGEGSESGLPCGVRKCTKVFKTVPYLEDHLKKRHQW